MPQRVPILAALAGDRAARMAYTPGVGKTDGNDGQEGGATGRPKFSRRPAVAPREKVRRAVWGREWGDAAKQAAQRIRNGG